MVDKMLLLYNYSLLSKLNLSLHCATLSCCFVTMCGLYAFCMTTRYPTDIELTILLQGTKLTLTLETNFILWLGIQPSQDFLAESRTGVHRN